MSGVGRFIRKRRAKRAAFMADPAIRTSDPHPTPTGPAGGLSRGKRGLWMLIHTRLDLVCDVPC